MKVTIEKISRKERTSKEGKPYISVGIQVNGEWYNGFPDGVNSTWKSGDIVDVELIRNGDFKNFKAINPIPALEARINAIEVKLGITPPDFNEGLDGDIPF